MGLRVIRRRFTLDIRFQYCYSLSSSKITWAIAGHAGFKQVSARRRQISPLVPGRSDELCAVLRAVETVDLRDIPFQQAGSGAGDIKCGLQPSAG